MAEEYTCPDNLQDLRCAYVKIFLKQSVDELVNKNLIIRQFEINHC